MRVREREGECPGWRERGRVCGERESVRVRERGRVYGESAGERQVGEREGECG